MRDKIAELFKEFYDKTFAYYYYHNEANLENVTPDQYADLILALFEDAELKWYNTGWEDAMKGRVKK